MAECQQKLVMHRLMTLRKKIEVDDVYGECIYSVRSKAIATSKTFVVSDKDGNSIATIQQQLSLIVPKYKITIIGEESFSIRRSVSLYHSYSFKGITWKASGDFQGYRYQVDNCRGETLFEIRKEIDRWDDRYHLNIFNIQYTLHGVCIALAIDAAIHAIRSKD